MQEKKGFGIVYRSVMQMNISIYSKALYSLLSAYQGADDYCYPSLTQIAKDLGTEKIVIENDEEKTIFKPLSPHTIIKAIKELEQHKILKVERGNRKLSKYYLTTAPDTVTTAPHTVVTTAPDTVTTAFDDKPHNIYITNNTTINSIVSELENSDDTHEKLTVKFWKLFNENMKELKINSTDLKKAKANTWIDSIRLMMEKDERTEAEIDEVYNFLKTEKFNPKFMWRRNIRSMAKLREQFESLLIAARSQAKQSGSFAPILSDEEYEKAEL